MPKLPQISVVIRAHDPTKMASLAAAVRSVLAQRFDGRIEILLETSNFPDPLVLDDFMTTTEGKRRALPKTAAAQVELIHHNITWHGDSRVVLMRAGVNRARAPYVCFLDFDDVFKSRGLKRLYACAQAQGADLTIGNITVVRKDEQGGASRALYHSRPPSKVEMVTHNVVPIHSYLVRREAAKRSMAKVPALAHFEDYAFLLHVLSAGTVAFITPFTSVADYHITALHDNKYAGIEKAAGNVISKLRSELQFEMNTDDLVTPQVSDSLQSATNNLIAALPVIKGANLLGMVEVVEPVNDGVLIGGWCCNRTTPDAILWGVYGLTPAGDYVHLSQRTDRVDVMNALHLPKGLYGFSGWIDAASVEAVYVVAGTNKKRLPHLGEIT